MSSSRQQQRKRFFSSIVENFSRLASDLNFGQEP
jgi:hypothetical protein